MGDRRIAAGVVLVGGVLTAVSCFLDMYVTRYGVSASNSNTYFSLWGMRSDAPGFPRIDVVADPGLPVVAAAVVMALAAVCTLAGEKVAGVARVVTVVGAGVLFGVVLTFVVQVLYREALLTGSERAPDDVFVHTNLPGLYLLGAGALVGLAGAVLAKRARPVAEQPAPVVDDDTPPLGIAVAVEAKDD